MDKQAFEKYYYMYKDYILSVIKKYVKDFSFEKNRVGTKMTSEETIIEYKYSLYGISLKMTDYELYITIYDKELNVIEQKNVWFTLKKD